MWLRLCSIMCSSQKERKGLRDARVLHHTSNSSSLAGPSMMRHFTYVSFPIPLPSFHAEGEAALTPFHSAPAEWGGCSHCSCLFLDLIQYIQSFGFHRMKSTCSGPLAMRCAKRPVRCNKARYVKYPLSMCRRCFHISTGLCESNLMGGLKL